MNYEEGQALTQRRLGEAGLAPGARVLDVGCGPGNLARLAFAHPGPTGRLVGLDRDDAFLDLARAQHAERDATFLRAEASWEIGRELPRLFAEGGLPGPVVRAEADVASPGQPDSLVDRVRFVLPRLVAAGIPAEQIAVDTLGARLRAERDGLGQAWFGELAVAAWATRGAPDAPAR